MFEKYLRVFTVFFFFYQLINKQSILQIFNREKEPK